jgi:hypothetical protein
MIVAVFDPLALVLILAAQQSIRWARGEDLEPKPKSEFELPDFIERIRRRFKKRDDGFVELNAEEQLALNQALQEAYEPQESSVTVEELTEEEIDRVNKLAAEYADPPQEPDFTDYSDGVATADPEPEEELPVKKPRWSGFGFPMSSLFNKSKEEVKEEPVLITRIAYPESNVNVQVTAEPNPMAMDERPGDYVEETKPRPRISEAAPGPNRGVMNSLPIQADNAPALGKASNSDFGNTFPPAPEKGDVYLRTDFLPNRLFKFNGQKWIEVDKESTDVYAYEEAYIKHLIEEIDAGRYDPDSLTDVEREQIAEYLGKNA